MSIETYDDRDVINVAMNLVNTGDGLSESLRIAPIPMRIGDRHLLLVEAVVKEVRHRPAVKDEWDGPLTLVGVLKAESATITDNATVRRLLDKHKRALEERRQIEGQQKLEGVDNDDDGDDDEDEDGD